MNYLNFENLVPGDILLCRGDGLISDLIELFDGGIYSHSALYIGVVDGSHSVIQATSQGVACNPLTMLEQEIFTDVFRFNKSNHKIGDENYPFKPIDQVGSHYVAEGLQYAYDHLILLAVLTVTRQIPLDPMTKKILRKILDNAAAYIFKLLDQGKTPMVCSELVYRCFDEADEAKKYQLNISALEMSARLQDDGGKLNEIDEELLKAKQNFIDIWHKAKQAEYNILDFVSYPVAACVSPKDISTSKDLQNIGRLNFK
ncbi:hypothetical protein [Cellulosilyticum sp. I15G10I2]|uniref:hypothetical protein n=1 Tax=Cellulosilyticum sp. I15G10I2 TaxID=1892843 RepID=UPI00085BDB96|nr:hypothetical protein [Cellulosilyticum sp. I15G10I2]